MSDKTEVRTLVRLDPQALLAAAVEKGAEIETLERLVALAKDVRAEQARQSWYAAMAEFQRTCPPILKSAEARIATRTGPGYSYRYAPLDAVMGVVLPVLGPLGLSVAWRTRMEAGNVIAVCRVSHEGGHTEESGDVAMPVAQSDTGATPAQKVGSAMTYARRYALLAILGLAPEDDDDAASHVEARTVTMPQRKEAPPPADVAPPPPGKAAPLVGYFEGFIHEITRKEGSTEKGPWTMWILALENGMKVATFSETDSGIADRAYMHEQAVRIEWEEGAKGKRLTAIEIAGE
ncbi:MAG TPA: ERF family protein [Gemmatimonadaceae bacterium]